MRNIKESEKERSKRKKEGFQKKAKEKRRKIKGQRSGLESVKIDILH